MWTYIIIGVVVALVLVLCFALAVASFSFDNFSEKLKELNMKPNSYGITTLEYADKVNKQHFGDRLKLAKTEEFKDHYSRGVVALSEKTMQSNSLASLAIVSHEFGHARQDTTDTLNRHWKLRKSGRICGLFFMPLVIAAATLSVLWGFGVLPQTTVLVAGCVCFGGGLLIFAFAIVLKYKEIKIEKQASAFALEFLQEILLEEEVQLCKQFLDSACLTYWAALIRTLLSWTMLTGKNKMFK